MARPKAKELTERELEVMHMFWEHGEQTIAQVRDKLAVQDRDLASLSDSDRHTVRRLQREYANVWVGILSAIHPGRGEDDLRVRAQACFGLINSTPHSLRTARQRASTREVRDILRAMAYASLAV